jgi:hypothetical protein
MNENYHSHISKNFEDDHPRVENTGKKTHMLGMNKPPDWSISLHSWNMASGNPLVVQMPLQRVQHCFKNV